MKGHVRHLTKKRFGKSVKIRKTWSMSKKRSAEMKFWPPKLKFFQKKASSWSAKVFTVPPRLGAKFPPLVIVIIFVLILRDGNHNWLQMDIARERIWGGWGIRGNSDPQMNA